MAERTEREVLNHLIEICKDGERGFRTAASYVQDPSLKTLFNELAEQRHKFADDLIPHLHRLGGVEEERGTSIGALHRRWLELKGHIPHVDHTIVVEAARGEHAALGAYEEALNGMLPPTVTGLVEAQREELEKAQERLHALDHA